MLLKLDKLEVNISLFTHLAFQIHDQKSHIKTRSSTS